DRGPRARRPPRAGAPDRGPSTSEPQHGEIAIGDPRERSDRDLHPPLLVLVDEPVEEAGDLRVVVVAETGLADELGVAAAPGVHGWQAALERLDQRVRARIVEARRKVDVVGAEELAELPRADRRDDVRARQLDRRAAGEGQPVPGRIELACEPAQRLA